MFQGSQYRIIKHSKNRYEFRTPYAIQFGTGKEVLAMIVEHVKNSQKSTIELSLAKQKLLSMAEEDGLTMAASAPAAEPAPTPSLPPPLPPKTPIFEEETVEAPDFEPLPDEITQVCAPKPHTVKVQRAASKRRHGLAYLRALLDEEQQQLSAAQ